jgi:hypothetical protein
VSPALLTRTWQVTALTEQVGQAPVTDLFRAAQPCWNDNRYEFEAQGGYTLHEGPRKCNEDDPATRTGRWELTPDTQHFAAVITFGAPSAGAEARLQGQIEALTAERLVLVQADTVQGVVTRTRTTLQAD